MPERYQTCLDGFNELADISVSDAWTRDENGEYKFKEHSRMLIRTSVGTKLLQSAIEADDLIVHDVTTKERITERFSSAMLMTPTKTDAEHVRAQGAVGAMVTQQPSAPPSLIAPDGTLRLTNHVLLDM